MALSLEKGGVVYRLLVLLVAVVVALGGLSAVSPSADAIVPGAVDRIVFVSNRDHSSGEIYARDFAGGAWKRLTSNATSDGSPAWSPDSSEIVFSSSAAGPVDIWVMNADGTNQRNVTNEALNNSDPAWSPDGSQIAYSSDSKVLLDLDVWVVNANGSGKTNLTPSTPGTQDRHPAWSPDGSRIAFVSNRDGYPDIFVMNSDGSNARNLTNNHTWWDTSPAWSPDGSKIAFVSDRAGTARDIYVMNADGSDQREIANLSYGCESPAWSPDGRHVSFDSVEDGDRDLWMVDPDGSNLGHLTDHSGNEWMGAWESVNRLPSAVDDGSFYVRPGGTLNGSSVLANDNDPDGDSLVAKPETSPSHTASFKLAADGTFTYVHDGSAARTDMFTYRAEDSRSGGSAPATVTIQIGVPDTVGLVDPGTGMWRLRNGAGVVTQFYYGNPGDYPFVGDWNCNDVDTPGLYRQSDGFAYLRNANSQGIADRTFFFGNPGDVPIAGDFNGDGCDTLSIYRPSEARFYVINALGKNGGGLGAADYSFLFGDPGDKPVVGDWDRDKIDEIGLHRESSGFFYYRNTLSTGIAHGQFYFGDPGDRFVAGDWGLVDGADTPGLFRPSNQVFYFRHNLTQGNADSQFTWTGAGSGWLPVAGDFNLD
jgi:Tol biopolymer transport system component